MKLNYNLSVLTFALLFALAATLGSCSDWTDTEPLDQELMTPDKQNPAEYAAYAASVRAYKQSAHAVVYARMENAVENPVSGKNFILTLPDSLDLISLVNADRLTDIDLKDMRQHQNDFGTRFLYYINAAAYLESAKFSEYLDLSVSRAAEFGFDGFVVGTESLSADAEQLVVSKLSSMAGPGKGKVLILEGNPGVVAKANLPLFDYVVFNTSRVIYTTDLLTQIDYVTQYVGVVSSRLILAAEPRTTLYDKNLFGQNALTETAYNILSLGNLGGLAVFNIASDYFHANGNYTTTREAISILNPSK